MANSSPFNRIGQISFHPSGNFFIYMAYNNGSSKPILYKFNKQTGEILKVYMINTSIGLDFVCQISSDSTVFFSDRTSVISMKIDLHNRSKTENSLEYIITRPLPPNRRPRFGDIQKISPEIMLVANYQQTPFYDAIFHNEDTTYFIDSFIYHDSIKANITLPVFNESDFHSPSIDFSYDLNCRTNTIHLVGKDTFGANIFNYTIIDSTGPSSNVILNSKKSSYTFTDSGIYKIWFIASNGSKTDSVMKVVEVLHPIPQGFLGEDTLLCLPGNTISLQAPQNLHCYRWYNEQQKEVGSSYEFLTESAGTFICHSTDNNFCTIRDTIVVKTDSRKYNLKLQRKRDTIVCINPPSGNNPQYHWYKNGNGLITLLEPKLTITDTGKYHLMVSQEGLCPSYSDTLHIDSIYGPTNVVQIPIQDLKIYPNPAQDYLTIDWQGNEDLNIVLINAEGKQVLQQNISPKSNQKIDVSQIAKGVYLLQVNGAFGGKVLLE